ncbi:g10635 [Coccomyxa viridis]|uniref:mannan endo-1,4-beta-mannosidase n=1 Tax=Coccomyxa viridis TaxID=1274662 RepID=A0ABP1G5V9_9CHLO
MQRIRGAAGFLQGAAVLACLLGADAASQGFIGVSNGAFVDANCTEFIPVGWNSWVSLNKAATAIVASLPTGAAGLNAKYSNTVTKLFKAAVSAKFTAVRLFLHGEDEASQLQTQPGVYNEAAFRGIDYIIAVAGLYGVKAIVVPVNNWLEPNVGDGKQQYMKWAGIPKSQEDTFWTNPTVRNLIKNDYKVLVTRKNTFNGKLYGEDNTIFAWDIYNEPRCPASQNGPGCPGSVTQFYADLSSYLKSINPNQLITPGEEGFFAVGSGFENSDPSGVPSNVQAAGRHAFLRTPFCLLPRTMLWSAKIGQDFVPQCSLLGIDYCSIHLWPDNWNTFDPKFPASWVTAHETATKTLNKPLVLEEFGKSGDKTATYQAVFSALEQSLANGGQLRGALFWRWNEDGGSDLNTVYTNDSTWKLIEAAIARISPYYGRPLPGCVPTQPGVVAFSG